MAPEQLEGRGADARSDIFAFGTIVYEIVTGRKAFDGSSRASLIAAIMSSEPPPVSSSQPLAPAALDRIVQACLEKDQAPSANANAAYSVAQLAVAPMTVVVNWSSR